MTPGPSVPYTPLLYGLDAGFFKDQGLDVQAVAVRAGQVAIASLVSGEVDIITQAGTAVAAAIRGLPVKIILVSSDRPNHELLAAPNIKTSQDLKGKSIGLGSLEGTGGIIVRRILQAKGLNPDTDVSFISMGTEVRLHALMSGTIAAAMLTPPYTFLAYDHGCITLGKGKDYVRYLTEGVVTSNTKVTQKRPSLIRFLKGWNKGVSYYRANPGVMVPYIQKKFGIADRELARRMYEYDSMNRLNNGEIDHSAMTEILDIAKQTMKTKTPFTANQLFDFSLLEEAK